MSTKDFTANVISASKVVPDGNFKDSKASGIWDINEALDLIKGGNWPNVANINPSAFVDALFSTHLYYGTNSAQTITNNIDLSGKGGLVWQKMRVSDNDASDTQDHYLRDTARGGGYRLNSNTRNAQASDGGITAFNSNGFSLSSGSAGNVNQGNYVSWTFRKQPKFFDIQTYTGNGSVRNISHNLGSVPGMIIVKCTSAGSSYWTVYHRALDASSPEDKYLYLDSTNAVGDFTGYWNDTAPTSSVFTLGTGNGDDTNANGETYVAYLFAHNNDDGGFGEPGDQDIIKCGGYTGTGASGNKINLGFEPQWLLIKDTNDTNSWVITDTMRGLTSSTAAGLFANVSNVEFNSSGYAAALHADGFTPTGSNGNNTTYIYMAIRRGGMQTPTAASDVFAIDTFGSTGDGVVPGWRSGFPVDMAIYRITSGNNDGKIASRLTAPKYLRTNSTAVESTDNDFTFDYNNGWYNYTGTAATYVSYMWARARGYFDIVCYTGSGNNSTRVVDHDLAVKPEMVWIKRRSGDIAQWFVTTESLGADNYLNLEESGTGSTSTNMGAHTATQFSARGQDTDGAPFIAYLFATCSGVSKVGSFTQSGATNVACGFTGNTPSLVILKRTDASGDWYLLRDIVAGNDKSFYFNTNALEITNADIVDPYSGGFATTSSLTDGDYIFYAIAAIS